MKKVSFSFLLFLIFANGFSQINYNLYNEFPKGPVGGGAGYEAIVSLDRSFTLVNTLSELKTALANPSITKIFIYGDKTFEINSPIEITTRNLILASNRGQFNEHGRISPGAHLKLMNASVEDNNLLISIKANNVRITGLRLSSEDKNIKSTGIQISHKPGLQKTRMEVDNCELYYWGYAAIKLNGVLDDTEYLVSGKIHHNHIHNNNKDGLGYGTVINYKNVHSQIVYNYYNKNRHSIAGNGRINEKYTAAYNLTLKNEINSEYDMHGYSDYSKRDCNALKICNPYNACNEAGTEIILLNNAVVKAPYFFGLRGIPTKGAYVTRNFYKAPIFYKLWRTWTYDNEIGSCNLSPPNNRNIKLSKCKWKKYNLSVFNNNVNPHGRNYLRISWSGINKWRPLFFNAYKKGRIAFGDFDGDNVDDIFYGTGKSWQVSWKGVTPWEKLEKSNYQAHQLAFGDFNNDGKTDVFLGNGKEWKVSWSGSSKWQKINKSNYKTNKLALGDFDGNDTTDVFLGNGKEWKVSWNGTSKWEKINTSSYKTNKLAFGDFNGDGKTDIFLGNGKEWKVSWGGTSKWKKIQKSSYKTHELAFGDFNNDGKTDVFLGNGKKWRISWGGTSKWQKINTSSYKTKELKFGDFNGDGKTDVILEKSF